MYTLSLERLGSNWLLESNIFSRRRLIEIVLRGLLTT